MESALMTTKDGLPAAEWVEPEMDHVVARLEEAYQETGKLRAIAAQAAAGMLCWTWERTARGLLAVLEPDAGSRSSGASEAVIRVPVAHPGQEKV